MKKTSYMRANFLIGMEVLLSGMKTWAGMVTKDVITRIRSHWSFILLWIIIVFLASIIG